MRSPRNWRGEYDLKGYGRMVADRVRMDAYREALRRCIAPGAHVVDVGAGTGIMALLACQLGAARVHAIDDSEALAIARELALANGCADRIEFHQATSYEVHLPRPADVLVSDLRGVLPLHGAHVDAIVDARRRLLAPGGAQIPRRDTIFVALVADAPLHAETLQVWRDGAYGLDLSPGLRWAAHQVRKVDLAGAQWVGPAAPVIELDYATLASPNASGATRWQLEQPRTAHGIGAWFDTVLTEGVGFSNAPDRPRAIYGQAFLPFPEPLRLEAGEHVAVRLAATRIGRDYVWQWDTTVEDAHGAARLQLRQSTFHGQPLNPPQLGRRAATHVPTPTAQGRAASRALALMDRGHSVDDIARQLAVEFPELLAPGQAQEFVADLCDWFAD